jgi:hypothetical protein
MLFGGYIGNFVMSSKTSIISIIRPQLYITSILRRLSVLESSILCCTSESPKVYCGRELTCSAYLEAGCSRSADESGQLVWLPRCKGILEIIHDRHCNCADTSDSFYPPCLFELIFVTNYHRFKCNTYFIVIFDTPNLNLDAKPRCIVVWASNCQTRSDDFGVPFGPQPMPLEFYYRLMQPHYFSELDRLRKLNRFPWLGRVG